jgi:hypothetical protein
VGTKTVLNAVPPVANRTSVVQPVASGSHPVYRELLPRASRGFQLKNGYMKSDIQIKSQIVVNITCTLLCVIEYVMVIIA